MNQNRGADGIGGGGVGEEGGGRGPHHRPEVWREIDWSEENLKTLKQDVETFVPLQRQNQFKRMNILLLGQVAAGKSSIVNTITSIFEDYASHKAEIRSSNHSGTRIYREYQMRSSTRNDLAFRLCDTKGIEIGETIRTVDIQRMIDGEKSDMETSAPSYDGSYTDKLFDFARWMRGWISRPKALDINKRAYCVVYVIDASSLDIMHETVENYFKDCRKLMKQNGGIPEIVVLTKADDCSNAVKGDLKAISYCPDIKKVVQMVMDKFGFHENQIFPVVNMLKEVRVRRETSILFLMASRQMLFEGRQHIQELVDKKKINIDVSGDHIVQAKL